MRATFLALSFLHSSREDGGKKGSSHFDEKLSFWWDTTVVAFNQCGLPRIEDFQFNFRIEAIYQGFLDRKLPLDLFRPETLAWIGFQLWPLHGLGFQRWRFLVPDWRRGSGGLRPHEWRPDARPSGKLCHHWTFQPWWHVFFLWWSFQAKYLVLSKWKHMQFNAISFKTI